MYVHADMRGSGTLLLALDGVLVGLVVEADTSEGWLRRYDTRELALVPTVGAGDCDWKMKAEERSRRIAKCPIVRVEGKVDFVGDTATDPDWMISQRLAAVRIRHGLPIDVSVAHDTSGMAASILERLAAQLRLGSMVAVDVRQSRDAERFLLPDDKTQYVPTGRMSLSVNYESPDAARAHEAAKADWSRRHPELVADHIRSLTEGEARVVEEVEAAAAARVRSAEMCARLRQ